ncbi:NUDIX domain-containing protein [Exiguobacterium sp. B2(2022)]|uniref:NUDIX domain-containing protein n=1 Tax=Exiguobacterium sp. B2(2022) TaxID=2992755 RepID=UPI00237B7E1A|nr:NUDIX domain-containing protein [Exiguobacterium sp. B2(2022)]MDE0562521.1 NUDIX domain-containing protein [Exiguobacterium sp. B2(2022)]
MSVVRTKLRSAIILMNDQDEVALIRREKENVLYYVFPGGGVEYGHTTEETAVREAFEELGVHVELEGVAAYVAFNNELNPYYWAKMTGGEFGTGTGEEFQEEQTNGSYTPMWIKRSALPHLPVRPPSLAEKLASHESRFYDLTLSED